MTRSDKDNSGKTHYLHHCLQILDKVNPADPDPVLMLGLADCGKEDDATPPGAPSQKWTVESNSDGTATLAYFDPFLKPCWHLYWYSRL